MTPIIFNREILLIDGTSFSRQELCSNIPGSETGKDSLKELEQACWAGLLFELLPEIAIDPRMSSSLFIWHVLTAQHFLLINQGTYPGPVEPAASVDPHLFVHALILN